MYTKTCTEVQTTKVAISRGLNTRVYINSSLMSNIGPSTKNASLLDTLNSVKLAATKASASEHRHNTTANSIITGIARYGVSRENCCTWSGSTKIRTSAARAAPNSKNTAMSITSCSEVSEIRDSRPNSPPCGAGSGSSTRPSALTFGGAALSVSSPASPYLVCIQWTTSPVTTAVRMPRPARNSTISTPILCWPNAA